MYFEYSLPCSYWNRKYEIPTGDMWLRLQSKLPMLTALAKSVLCLVCTSCSVERQNKQNAYVHTLERNRLSIANLSDLLFVRYATVHGKLQTWRSAPPAKRTRNRLTSAEQNARKKARASPSSPSSSRIVIEDDEDEDDEEAEEEKAEDGSAGPEEGSEDELEAAVFELEAQEGVAGLRALVDGVDSDDEEEEAREILPPPAPRRTSRGTAGKDTRERL
jgi:hypothetical protein